MKTSTAIGVFNAINSLAGQAAPLKFSYACARNRSRLSDLFEAFEKNRVELAKQHAKKDKAGDPISADGKFDIADMPAFEKELDELAATDVDVELHKVSINDFPTVLTVNVMEALLPMTMEADAPALAPAAPTQPAATARKRAKK